MNPNCDIFDPNHLNTLCADISTHKQVDSFIYDHLINLNQRLNENINSQLKINGTVNTELEKINTSIKNISDQVNININKIKLLDDDNKKFANSLTEQSKLINTSITDFKTNLANFNDLLNVLTQSNLKLNNDITDIKNKINIDKLNEVINAYEKLYNALDDKIKDYLKPINTSINELSNAFNVFKSDYDNKLDTLNNNLTAKLNSFISEANNKFSDQDQKIISFKASVSQTLEDFKTIYDNKIKSVLSDIDNVNNSLINKINKVNGDLIDKINNLNSELTTKIKYNTDLINKVNSDSISRDTAIETDIKNLENKVNTNNDSLSGRMDDLEKSDDKQTNLINSFVETVNNVVTLSNKLNEDYQIGKETFNNYVSLTNQSINNLNDSIQKNKSLIEKATAISNDFIVQWTAGSDITKNIDGISIRMSPLGNSPLTLQLTLDGDITSFYSIDGATNKLVDMNTRKLNIDINSTISYLLELKVFKKDNTNRLPRMVFIFYNSSSQTFNIVQRSN